MTSTLTEALRAFLSRYPDDHAAHQRVRGWLLDHAPTDKRAVRGMAAVSRLELPAAFIGKPRVDAFAFRRWVKRLAEEEALPVDLAEASLLAWLDAAGVEAPESAALQGPLDTGALTGAIDALSALHLALDAARIHPVAQVRLESSTKAALRELVVAVSLSGTEVGSRLRSTTWTQRVDLLRGGQSAVLDKVTAHVGPHVLSAISAPTPARWWLEVRGADRVLLRTFQDVTVLPPSTWLGERAPRVAAAAYIQPEDPVVGELVQEASEAAAPDDPRPATDRALDALLETLRRYEIRCSGAAPVNVSAPRRIFASGGSALDGALLLAACLEFAGLSALLVTGRGGAAVGVWGSQGRPALTDTDDPELLRRALRAGLLTLVDAERLERVGESWLATDTEGTLAAVDLDGARAAGVPPLPAAALDDSPGPLPDGELGDRRQRLLDRASLADTGRKGMRRRGAWAASLSRHLAVRDVPPRVQGWKNRLLDLTLRNPLLNFRVRSTTIPLLAGDLGDLKDALASGRALSLEARPSPALPGQPSPTVTGAMRDGSLNAGRVIADLTAARLPKSARGAWRAGRTYLDEGGIHAMFLVFGMLQFFEPGKPEVPRRAPLLLVPVEMKQQRSGPWRIRRADRETEFNVALLEYLQREHGIDIPGVTPLPMDHAGVDVLSILDRVERAISESHVGGGWRVERSACVGILAFTRVRMWRDLESRSADLLRHPLVRRLALVEDEEREEEALPQAHGLDERWSAGEIFCPMLADGSQLSAIAAAHAGRSFVLEGPPGTGKSQTIGNIIAHSLAHGRSVLFVSQKRAALEVVHDRLARVGLGPLCLELHSNKARKSEFLDQLRAASQFRARRPRRDWADRAGALQALINELGALPRSLHQERPPGRTLAEAVIERWSDGEGDPMPCDFEAGRASSVAWMDEARQALRELVAARKRLQVTPDTLEGIRATRWPQAAREAGEAALIALEEATALLQAASAALTPALGELADLSSDALDLLRAVLVKMLEYAPPSRALLEGREADVEVWRHEAIATTTVRDGLAERYKPSVLKLDVAADRLRLAAWMSIPLLGWLMLWGVRARARLVALFQVNHAALFNDYEAVEALSERMDALKPITAEVMTLIGPLKEDTWGLPVVPDVDALLDYSRSLRQRATRFPRVIDLASEAGESRVQVRAWLAAFDAWESARRVAREQLNLSARAFGGPAEAEHLARVASTCAAWRGLSAHWREWGAYRRARSACNALGLKRAARAIEAGELGDVQALTGDLVTARFDDAWRAWWLRHHRATDPVIAGYDPSAHAEKERRFQILDEDVRALCQEVVVARVAARQPSLDQGAPPSSPAGILLRQFKRKTGLATPRRLFSECAGLIRQLKPCVLMSPLSVAQYIDPSQPPFDLVIFDEASQVPLHEAIGAIARGRQVIVVGDSKQLPPTAFFAGAGEEEDSDSLVAELESILDECIAAGLPSLRLSWHYRSRHHALIAFSNGRYYDGELQVLPAARADTPGMGLSLVHVPNAVYDRGGTATNAVEARAVVDDVLRRLRDPAERRRSLCVVTFSGRQQALIEDLLESERLSDPSLEPWFDGSRAEPLLVKNLENVQGDERDVVLFSIGYGPDKRGRMTANLGPLGQVGGERRLNVAVTRAREALVVFCSFTPDQLDLSRISAQGSHDLKAFLEDAAARGTALIGHTHRERDAASDAVTRVIAERLRAEGWVVEAEVGEGAWRLDLGVRSRTRPEEFVLGIELDGPRYAATPTVRDRDRLRWSLMRGLGWRGLYRVRLLAWLEDSERVLQEILETAETAELGEAGETAKLEPGESVAPEADGAEVMSGEALAEETTDDPSTSGLVQPGDAEFAEVSVVVTTYRPLIIGLGPRSSYRRKRTIEHLYAVVAQEGPVHHMVAARRVAKAWGFTRITTRFHEVIRHCQYSGTPLLVRKGEFLWPADKGADWRGYQRYDASVAESRRRLDEISLEELANAAQHIVQRFGRSPRTELMKATIKVFGITALTATATGRMQEALRLLAARGEVEL